MMVKVRGSLASFDRNQVQKGDHERWMEGDPMSKLGGEARREAGLCRSVHVP